MNKLLSQRECWPASSMALLKLCFGAELLLHAAPAESYFLNTLFKTKPVQLFWKQKFLAVVNDGIAPPQRILFPPEKICMDWQQTQSVGVGLQNLGNTCFLNSTLQCLTYTPPLANYMLSLEHTKSCEYFLTLEICWTAPKVKEKRVLWRKFLVSYFAWSSCFWMRS